MSYNYFTKGIFYILFITSFSHEMRAQTKHKIDKNQSKNIKFENLGDITFMSKNLNVSEFRDGTPIQEAKSSEDWRNFLKTKEPAWCYFEYDYKNDKKFGKLYNYYAITDKRGLSPLGWHIPNIYEIEKILNNDVKINPRLYKEQIRFVFKSNNCFVKNSGNINGHSITELFSGVCLQNGSFDNTKTNKISSWWSTSTYSSKKNETFTPIISEDCFVYPIVFNVEKYMFNYNSSINFGNINEGRSVICFKDYQNTDEINSKEIIVNSSTILPKFKVLDSVKIGIKQIKLIKDSTYFYYNGKLFSERKIYDKRPSKWGPDGTVREYRTTYIGEDSLKRIQLYDTTYEMSYVYNFENSIFTEALSFGNTDLKLYTKWGDISLYQNKEVKKFINSSISNNRHIAFAGRLNNYLPKNEYIKLLFSQIDLVLDVSPISINEGITISLNKLNRIIPINFNSNLISIGFDSLFSNTIIADSSYKLSLLIKHIDDYRFISPVYSQLIINEKCDFNIPRKDYYFTEQQITIDKEMIVDLIYSSYFFKLKKMVDAGEISEAINFFKSIATELPDLKNIDHKKNFENHLVYLINTSTCKKDKIYNSLLSLLKVDSLKNWAKNIIIDHFKATYAKNPELFYSDYKSFNRNIKDLTKGLYIIFGNSKLNNKLLMDNDASSFDCQILNSLLAYNKIYPEGHWGIQQGGSPADIYNLNNIGIYIHNGDFKFLPNPINFDCSRFPGEYLPEVMNYIKRASAIKPNSIESKLFKTLFTKRNFYQKHLDQCTVSDICTQCDDIGNILKNKKSLPLEYFEDLSDYYRLNCISCALCDYNICGGEKPTKKNGTPDMRYKVNRNR